MRRINASFELSLLGPSTADRQHVDKALNIFVQNTSPLLRTKTHQIRQKIAQPVTPEGTFYFAALCRSASVIGFAMFGYYPNSKLIVVDHMVIDRDNRGDAAFYIFAQLLHDAIQGLDLEVDFTAVELEDGNEYGSEQTGGNELVRLLGQVGFGKVHAEYFLPNIENVNYEAKYPGILMLRGSQKLYRIRREDLLRISRGILFEHYLPWYRDFFGKQTAAYQRYLGQLYENFANRLGNQPIIKINGPESDALIATPASVPMQSTEVRIGQHIAMFAAVVVVACTAIYELNVPPNWAAPLLISLVASFGGIVAISSGKSFEVFETAIQLIRGGKQKLHYQNNRPPLKRVEKPRPQMRNRTKGSGAEIIDKQD
ncbi:hypothetical protein [Bradyrhizobium sp. SZCCHNR2026]|uniref:hypothetical protein n=1 Tax=Bradyrhizobium sp. SZCCHNR2026 TaxID=3057381 RepID=UPI002915FED0|nr:hypothetical protein [Bradyrhizobium sp. SZCCHNR2026]